MANQEIGALHKHELVMHRVAQAEVDVGAADRTEARNRVVGAGGRGGKLPAIQDQCEGLLVGCCLTSLNIHAIVRTTVLHVKGASLEQRQRTGRVSTRTVGLSGTNLYTRTRGGKPWRRI